MTTFFHAWRRNQANRQAAEWLAEQTEARVAVSEAPKEIRDQVRRLVDTLFEGADGEVEPALNQLWDLLGDYPGMRERFARLRIVADAVDFLKDRTDPHSTKRRAAEDRTDPHSTPRPEAKPGRRPT